MLAFLSWWITIQLFGLAALPLARRIFAWLPDRGYAFSKTAGLLLVSYLLWLGSITGILANNPGGILFALLVTAGISAWVGLFRPGARAEMRQFWQANKRQIILVEALFLLAFAGWELVRAYAPDKILPLSGEKYMETAFLNGVLNSPHFPPLDPWMSGYAISYYYFGYVMMGVMTSFTGVAPTVGFDLYDALLFALTAITAYGVVFNLIMIAGGSKRAAGGFGLLGALFVGGMGNLEGLLEGLYSSGALPTAFWQWLNLQGLNTTTQPAGSFFLNSGWWWWNASRVLHDLDLSGQSVGAQPIDEFPFFSFLLGDNHPHKLALPFVLLAIGLALNLLMMVVQRGSGRFDLRRENLGRFLFYALTLGGLAFLNTWDFPIYLGLALLAYAVGRLITGDRFRLRLAWPVLGLGVGLGAAAILLYIFFYVGFASQAGGVLPYVFPPTRLPQYLVIFGPFIFILAFFVVTAARRAADGEFPINQAFHAWAWIAGLSYGAYVLVLLLAAVVISSLGFQRIPAIAGLIGDMSLGEWLARVLLARLANPWLFLALSALLALAVTAILHRPQPVVDLSASSDEPGARIYPAESRPLPSRLNPATLFALLLAFTGLALTLVVEFFYLRDNFGVRMNTIFKFYFQGWVMMACASAFAAWWVSRFIGRAARVVFAVGTALLVSAGLVYTVMGITSRVESFQYPPNMDAAATFAGDYPTAGSASWAAHPDDWAAIQWLLQNGRLPDGSVPNILEAGAGGYENAGRISAFTGFPTILGWTNHEGQWRGNDVEIKLREPVIQNIFTTYSADQALADLHRWKVQYVIIGDTERQYVARLCENQQRPCNSARALGKFNSILTPVFKQGGTTVFRVPGQ